MPGIAFHLLCAQRALPHVRAGRRAPSFSIDDPDLVNAFYQGAVGPDMGYFRGGGRWISDLAHQARSADLARAMLESARDELQVAYAWGWVTHLLADVAVHPLINRAAAELRDGAAAGAITPTDCPASHLRVELGLDAYFLMRFPGSWRGCFDPAGSARRVRLLATAFRRTHGQEVRAVDLWAAQRASLLLAPFVLRGTRMVGDAHSSLRRLRVAPTPGGPARHAGTHDRGALVRACLTPVAPRPWLIRGAGRVLRGFADRFRVQFDGDLRNLPNYDLDTGRLAGREAEAPQTLVAAATAAHTREPALPAAGV